MNVRTGPNRKMSITNIKYPSLPTKTFPAMMAAKKSVDRTAHLRSFSSGHAGPGFCLVVSMTQMAAATKLATLAVKVRSPVTVKDATVQKPMNASWNDDITIVRTRQL